MPNNNCPIPDAKFKWRGFTLLELIVSLGIMAIVVAVAIPNLRDFNRGQEIENTATQFMGVLRTGQSNAVSRIKCPYGNEGTTSWQVDLNISGAVDTYDLVANCVTTTLTLPQRRTFTSPFAGTPTNPVTFDAAANVCSGQNVNIIFTGLETKYQCNGAGNIIAGEVRVTLSKAGFSNLVVVIEPGGIIRVD